MIKPLPILLTIAAALLFCWVAPAFPQSPTPLPGPTPDPAEYETVQGELAAWWGWSLLHPNVVMRPDKVYRVTGRGTSGREYQEKLKVVGALPGRPPDRKSVV